MIYTAVAAGSGAMQIARPHDSDHVLGPFALRQRGVASAFLIGKDLVPGALAIIFSSYLE